MARILDQVIGHQLQIQQLLNARQNGQLHHTLLFCGPNGVGRKMIALGLGQALVCEKSDLGCGHCGPCTRMAKRQSESLIWIEPEKQQIKIEQAEQVLEFLQLRSMSAHRLVVIEHAEALNSQASNALLKCLEEPPSGTYIILIALSPQHILPTIRSRAQAWRFSPLTVEQMKKKSRAPEWVLHASQGSFERVSLLLEREEQDTRSHALQMLKEMRANPDAYLTGAWRELIRDRSHALSLLNHVLTILRDAIWFQQGERVHLMNLDQIELLTDISDANATWLHQKVQQVIDAEKAILAQRDVQLVFDEIWLSQRSVYV